MDKNNSVLENIAEFNYFQDTNNTFECIGGPVDFQNTYNNVKINNEKQKEEDEMRKFYKDVNYTMTPAQEDELDRYNRYIESLDKSKSIIKENYSGSSDSDSDY